MSRLGRKPVSVPAGVKVALSGRVVSVEGPKGKLQWEFRPEISVEHDAEAKTITVSRSGDERLARALHGLTRAVMQNMMVGVTQGYEKRLELVGVGYIAAVQGQTLQLRVGLANELQVPIPAGLKVACPDQQHIVIQGIDKQLVGQFSAEVRPAASPSPTRARASATSARRSAASKARQW